MNKRNIKWDNIHISLVIPIVLTFALFVLSFFFFVIPTCKKIKLESKQEMISELANSVWSMLNNYETDVRNGLLTEAEAQKEVLLRIKNLRYGTDQKGYFWINDMAPKMIMHPYNSVLDGKPLNNFKDANGKKIFLECVDIVKSKGEGFIYYFWQWKDNPDSIAPKLSFVKGFKPWGWMIGTGIYINDVNDEINAIQTSLIKISLFIVNIIVLLLISILFYSIRVARKKRITEKELDESKKNYKVLIDNSPDAIVVYDLRLNRFVDANLMAEKLFEGSYEELLKFDPQRFFSIIQADNRSIADIMKECFIKTLKGEHPVIELLVKTLKGKEFYCEIRLVKLPQTKHKQIRASFLDITLRRKAEEQLIRSESVLKKLNKDKDRFISILAHDLKNPFIALCGLSEVLKANIHNYDIKKIEMFVSHINDSAQNTYSLLEELLLWARSQSGKLPFNPQKLTFAEITQDVIGVLSPNALEKSIIIKHFTKDDIIIFADKDMLKTVLRNLISNAIKFTNPGGEVKIYAEKDLANITITVSDNGIGIAPNNLDKLFDISQAHTTAGTSNESGTGLGLILCKEFVEKHGGKIWVESENGSDFKFSLPMVNN